MNRYIFSTNIQYIINDELENAVTTFKATGGGALLMNVNNGEILSLVSLPNFDINKEVKLLIKITLIKLQKVFMN